jgi:lipid-A-disaccharide synthase
MRYYIISGEASGDLHGSNLIRAIHAQDPDADIRAWGGDKMQAAGATLVRHYRDLAFMGFVEVLMHLRTIFNNLSFCHQDISAFNPDVLVLIDYPGFNLRIAEWAKKRGIRTVYYISPQVWAWKENRVKKIKRDVDEMIVILPFEVEFYRKWKFPVTYVGHPLTEVVSGNRCDQEVIPVSQKPVIALLPGSRAQEIRAKLPVMLQMTERFPEYEFVVACAAAQPDSLYQELAAGRQITMVRDQTYNLLRQSVAALVTSGTATLETGLFGVPQVVCYKGNPVSYWLAKKLVRIKYISLVNLIMDKPVVTELIQNDLNPGKLEAELRKILPGGPARQRMETDYTALWHLLGDLRASQGAAQIVVMTAHRARN